MKFPMDASRFVALTADRGHVYALDDAGVAWELEAAQSTWVRLPHHVFCGCSEDDCAGEASDEIPPKDEPPGDGNGEP